MIKLVNLLKEVSVEQLKTQFVDSGKISQEDFNEIIGVTSKTAYVTWLVKKVVDKLIKVEDIYKYKKYFNIFDRRKSEYPFTDINQYKTQDDLSQFINKSAEIADKESGDVSQQKGVSKEDKYKEFYLGSVDGFKVYKLPEDRKDLYGASCELGSGTEWCTATGKTRNHFDSYISAGPLFIFLKPGSDEKYQFSYETDNFMDKNDDKVYSDDYGVKLKNKKELIFNFFKFIEEKYPEYKIPFGLKLTMAPELIAPDDLNVEDLDLFHSKDITSLPSGLKVNGKLDLSFTNISELPKDLKVSRWLDITGTPLAEKYLEKYKSNIFGSQKNKIKKAFKKDYPNLLGEEGWLIISNWDGN